MINCFKLARGLYWGVVVPLSLLVLLVSNFLIEKPLIAFAIFFVVFIVGAKAAKEILEENLNKGEI